MIFNDPQGVTLSKYVSFLHYILNIIYITQSHLIAKIIYDEG